jgi:hypothetical protein
MASRGRAPQPISKWQAATASSAKAAKPRSFSHRPPTPHRQQTFDSNGPNVKIRGNAYQVFERYIALAREAQAGGDRIAAENLYQHAEHYFRIMNAQGEGQGGGPPRPMTPADMEMATGDSETSEIEDMPAPGQPQPPSPSSAPQADEPPPSF